ncbi:MAG TPA: universal stress protein [Kiloniellaceae bacterium]|nr:universal stress protein [Kiloniellaceae bacterium]
MAYKTILTLAEANKAAGACRDAAIRLARQNDSHVAGLSLAIMPSRSTYLYHAALTEVLAAEEARIAQEAKELAAAFDRAMQKEGVNSESRVDSCLDVDALDRICQHARYADLIIIGQTVPEEANGLRRSLPEHLVLEAGRPVLMVPYIGLRSSFGKRVVVAWDGGREAARAIVDAMPILTGADEVEVVVIEHGKHDKREHEVGADISTFMARHGCKVVLKRIAAGDISDADCLLSHLADCDADLLVMGAYAHARLRQLVLGGVTQKILGQMTTPVLLSH